MGFDRKSGLSHAAQQKTSHHLNGGCGCVSLHSWWFDRWYSLFQWHHDVLPNSVFFLATKLSCRRWIVMSSRCTRTRVWARRKLPNWGGHTSGSLYLLGLTYRVTCSHRLIEEIMGQLYSPTDFYSYYLTHCTEVAVPLWMYLLHFK